MQGSRNQSRRRKPCDPRINRISTKSITWMVEEFKCVPSVFVPQESAGDTSEDEEGSKYPESRIKVGAESDWSG